jgi:chromosome segregation ATPase
MVSLSAAEGMEGKIWSDKLNAAKLGRLLANVNKAREDIVALVQEKYGKRYVSQQELEKAQRQIEEATQKVDVISSELVTTLQKLSVTQQKYLEHQCAVLYHLKEKTTNHSEAELPGAFDPTNTGNNLGQRGELAILERQFAEKTSEVNALRTEWEKAEASFKHRIECIKNNLRRDGLSLEKYDPTMESTTSKSFDSGIAVTNDDAWTASRKEMEQTEALLKMGAERNQQLEQDLMDYKTLTKALKGQVNVLQEKLETNESTEELDKAREQIQILKEDNIEAKMITKELQNMMIEYEVQLGEMQPQVESIPSLKDTIRELQSRLQELQESDKKEAKKAKDLLVRLQHKYRDVKLRYKNKHQELKNLKELTDKNMKTFQQESENIFKENKHLQDRAEQKKKMYQEEVERRLQCESELGIVKADLEEKQRLLADNESVKAEMSKLQQAQKDVEKRCTELSDKEKQKCAEATTLSQRVIELELLAENQRKEMSQITAANTLQKAALERKSASMQSRLDKQKQEKRELISLKREVLRLKKELGKSSYSAGGAPSGSRDRGHLEEELGKLKVENIDLKEQIEDLSSKNMELALLLARS